MILPQFFGWNKCWVYIDETIAGSSMLYRTVKKHYVLNMPCAIRSVLVCWGSLTPVVAELVKCTQFLSKNYSCFMPKNNIESFAQSDIADFNYQMFILEQGLQIESLFFNVYSIKGMLFKGLLLILACCGFYLWVRKTLWIKCELYVLFLLLKNR